MSGRALRTAFFVFLAAQAALLAAQHVTFFSELLRFPSRLASGVPDGAGSSLPLLAAAIGASALWAGRPWSWDRFAAAGLANVAAAGLAVYGAALATGRLSVWPPWAALAISAALAAVSGRAVRTAGALPPPAPFSPLDAITGVFLVTLLAPAVFPFVAFDAKLIWAWRAYAMRDGGLASALTRGIHPDYPPLDSIFLWLGIRDPLFEGRLLPWLLVVLFALFFRARLARFAPRLAGAGLLFVVATVHVWQGIATSYADVPLMVFAVGGSLLALGLPSDGASPSRFHLAAGALCLAAAVLVRPDGAATVAVVALAALWRMRARCRFAWLPAAAAAAAWASWAFRPALLRPVAGSFRFFANGGAWREAGPTAAAALAATAGTYLNALQGQWLSHKGLGTAVWLVALVAAHRARTGAVRADGKADEARFYGTVSFLSLGAVALVYAVMPFASDIRGAVAPDVFPTWLLAYRNFARVGMGRMAVHLLPFFVLYAVAVLAAASATIASSRSSARSIESAGGPKENRT